MGSFAAVDQGRFNAALRLRPWNIQKLVNQQLLAGAFIRRGQSTVTENGDGERSSVRGIHGQHEARIISDRKAETRQHGARTARKGT